jgi:predicted anti-sigma-YlaC factor YlaD
MGQSGSRQGKVSTHLTEEQLEAYSEKRLSVEELLYVSDHLAECEECRHQVERELGGDAAFFSLRSTALDGAEAGTGSGEPAGHLAMDQTAAYVDGMLSGDELQGVRDHLSSCELCTLAVEDLGNFRDQVAPQLSHEYRPAIAPKVVRVRAFPSLRFMSPTGVFTTALAALLLIVAGWLAWEGFRKRTATPKTAMNTPLTTATPATAPTAAPLAAQSPLIAQLNDAGGQLTLDQEGKLTGADALPAAYQHMVKEALSKRHIEESPLLAALKRPASSLLGGAEPGTEFSVSEPVGEVVFSDRPTFRWSKWDSSANYVVEVYDERYNLMATSPQLIGNSWKPPKPLRRGDTYSWQVIARKGDHESRSPRPPAPQAKFRVLAAARANVLVKARQAYASSHLALALLYAKDGLLTEAEQELRTLVKANPDSEVVRRLSADVSSMRRR